MDRWKKRLSIVFGIYSAVALILFVAFLLYNRDYVAVDGSTIIEPLISILTLSFLGLLLSYRRPENLISWLFVIIALMRQAGFLTTTVDILLAQGSVQLSVFFLWEIFGFGGRD